MTSWSHGALKDGLQMNIVVKQNRSQYLASRRYVIRVQTPAQGVGEVAYAQLLDAAKMSAGRYHKLYGWPVEVLDARSGKVVYQIGVAPLTGAAGGAA